VNVHQVTANESGQFARTLSAEEIAAAEADTVVIPADRNTGSRVDVQGNVSPSENATQISDGETILDEAARITSTDRNQSYGHPLDNHSRTAALWSAYLGISLTARDVCWLNVLQKGSRDRHRPGRDNIVDGCGFLRNAEMVEDEQERRAS
jgi:hypothetical protein